MNNSIFGEDHDFGSSSLRDVFESGRDESENVKRIKEARELLEMLDSLQSDKKASPVSNTPPMRGAQAPKLMDDEFSAWLEDWYQRRRFIEKMGELHGEANAKQEFMKVSITDPKKAEIESKLQMDQRRKHIKKVHTLEDLPHDDYMSEIFGFGARDSGPHYEKEEALPLKGRRLKDGQIISYSNPIMQTLNSVIPGMEDSMEESSFEVMLFAMVCFSLLAMVVFKLISSFSRISHQRRLEETIARAMQTSESSRPIIIYST
jgi:hypothetical protein